MKFVTIVVIILAQVHSFRRFSGSYKKSCCRFL